MRAPTDLISPLGKTERPCSLTLYHAASFSALSLIDMFDEAGLPRDELLRDHFKAEGAVSAVVPTGKWKAGKGSLDVLTR